MLDIDIKNGFVHFETDRLGASSRSGQTTDYTAGTYNAQRGYLYIHTHIHILEMYGRALERIRPYLEG